MSLDAFAVFVAFLALLEGALGWAAIATAVRGLRTARVADPSRRPLAALLAASLVATAVVSIPLFHLLLASWVTRWPGVMCVEGVRRIGAGTVGAARWLPTVVGVLDWTKPCLVFAAGAWLLLRRSESAARTRAAAFTAIALGVLALIDGALVAGYVALPKEEIAPATGCCMASSIAAAREAGLTPEGAADAASGAARYLFALVAAGLGASALLLRLPRLASPVATGVLALFGAAATSFAASFTADVAAPTLLGLPFHHCVWCTFAGAPETIVGAALCLTAALAGGWAFVARAAPGGAESAAARRLLAVASFGFLAAAGMSAVIAGMS